VGSENVSTLAPQREGDQEMTPHKASDHFAENLSTYGLLRDQEIFPLNRIALFCEYLLAFANCHQDQEKAPHIGM
jgi:hypothetical protein